MEQNKIPDLLIVSILDESGRNLDFIPSLINSFSNSQNHIFFYDHFDETTHLTIRIGDKDFDGPYQTNGSESYISMSFYNRHTIIPPKQYYFLYFVRILILEYLYKEISGETFKLFQKSSFQKLNELIWMSILPQYAQTTFQNLSNHSDENVRRIVQESHSIVRDIGDAYSLLLNRARQVGGILVDKALPGITDPHNLLQYIFMYSDLGKVKEVTQAINNEKEKGLFQLIDLLAVRPHSNAKDLLKGLSAARNLDEDIKDYASKALQKKNANVRAQATEKSNQTAQKSQSEDFITSGSDIFSGTDSIPTDFRDRNSKLGSFGEKLYSKLSAAIGDVAWSDIWPAWAVILEADAKMLEGIKLKIEKSGHSYIEAFILALGERGDSRAVPFLKSFISDKVTNDADRKIARTVLNKFESNQEHPKENFGFEVDLRTEHGLKIDETAKSEPETIGIASPAGITEDKNPVDALGYRVFANALGDLVAHESTTTPLTIGVCARWGQGKSVLLKYIEDRINDNESGGNFRECICIDFNAWKYTKSVQLWAEFYTKVIKEVESGLNFVERGLFRSYFFEKNSPWIFYLTLIGGEVTFLLLALLFVFLIQPTIVQLAVLQVIGPFATIISGIIVMGSIGTYVKKLVSSIPKQIFKKSHLPKFRQALGVQHEIFRSFDFVCDWLKTFNNKRIVVFVDDIDRCQPNEILQVIESMKLLLDTENFVFVLAMDPKVVRHAIGKSYEFMAEEKTDKERLGRNYLEKIIQIPFHLPRLTNTELTNLKNQLFFTQSSPGTSYGDILKPSEKTKDTTSAPQAKKAGIDDGFTIDPPLEVGLTTPLGPKLNVTTSTSKKTMHTDKKLSVKINDRESTAIDNLFDDNLIISPRLLTRLKNTYLLAKHFYVTEHNTNPPLELIKLLALSIKYPFEAVDIFEAMEDESKNKHWDSIMNACRKVNDREYDPNIGELVTMLKKHVPDLKVARELSKYVNYFNITAS